MALDLNQTLTLLAALERSYPPQTLFRDTFFPNVQTFVSDVVQIVTHSPWTHVGICLFGGIVEAVQPAVKISLPDRYVDYKTEYVDVDIPDREAALQEAKRLIGTPYGLRNCAAGGAHDVTGLNIPGDGTKTVDCSETVTRILRAGGLTILPGVPPDCVTPVDLYRWLKGA